MMNTLPKIDNTVKLAQEISAASKEQNVGINQVNNAIQQLNSVTQQNASASEELASIAEELASQAEQLKELISFFKIGKIAEIIGRNGFSNKEIKPVENITIRKPNILRTDTIDNNFKTI